MRLPGTDDPLSVLITIFIKGDSAMARAKDNPIPADDDHSMVTSAPDDWEFKTVQEEAGIAVIFEKFGDQFIGQFVGQEHITPDNGIDPFDIYNFRGRDQRLYVIGGGFSLEKAYNDGKFGPGDWVRLTYVLDVPSNKGNPMKSLRVEVRQQ